MGASVSQSLKAKIWSNEFIDLRTVLTFKEDPLSVTISSGVINLNQESKFKTPISIGQWTDAFLVFSAIYLEKYPNDDPHLLKYCHMVRELQRLYGDAAFRSYDERFRKLRESRNVPCQKPIAELTLKAATTPKQFSPKPQPQPFRVQYCFTFNRGNGVNATPAISNISVHSAGAITPNQNVVLSQRKIPPIGLPTPVKVSKLVNFLQGYDEEKLSFIREGLTEGFHLGCVGVPDTVLSKNHRNADQHPEVITQFIAKGQIEGRIAGPFLTPPPFEPFISSPLGVVPKSEPGKFRVIHDLSFPRNNSVNSRIPPENSQVTYDSIDTITMLVKKFEEGALMSKTDIQDAFRIIPIHVNDHKLLGFSWRGFYYYDKCLPMGASSSCQIFESLSTSLQWIMCSKFQASGMSHLFYWSRGFPYMP